MVLGAWGRGLLGTGVALALGCSATEPVCPADLERRVTPATASLAVGERRTVQGQFLGCGGTERLTDVIRWSVADSTVARVDAVTGEVTARAVGTTVVQGTGQQYGPLPSITITVRAP